METRHKYYKDSSQHMKDSTIKPYAYGAAKSVLSICLCAFSLVVSGTVTVCDWTCLFKIVQRKSIVASKEQQIHIKKLLFNVRIVCAIRKCERKRQAMVWSIIHILDHHVTTVAFTDVVLLLLLLLSPALMLPLSNIRCAGISDLLLLLQFYSRTGSNVSPFPCTLLCLLEDARNQYV